MKSRRNREGHPALQLPAALSALVVAAAAAAAWALWAPEAAAQSAPPAAQPGDPGRVVRQLIQAMKANDAVQIRALFAPHASQAYGNDKPKQGPAFFAWLESDIVKQQGQVDDAQFSVTGPEVIVSGQYHNNRGYRSAANFRIVVDSGRIVSWQMRY